MSVQIRTSFVFHVLSLDRKNLCQNRVVKDDAAKSQTARDLLSQRGIDLSRAAKDIRLGQNLHKLSGEEIMEAGIDSLPL